MIQLVAILSVFALGIIFAFIGAVKLKLAEKLKLDDAQVGGLISTLMFTSSFVVLIIGPLVDAWGHKPFAILGFFLGGLAIFMFSRVGSYSGAILACVLLGVGAMCVNTVGNTLMPIVLFEGQNAPRALNLGNMFFGLGAFLTPFLGGLLLQRIGFSRTVTIIAMLVLVPVVFALAVTSYPALPPSGFQLTTSLAQLTNVVVVVAAIALFCYIGLEASMGGWITTYLTQVGLGAGAANGVLSAFWIGVMASRLVTGASTIITPDNGAITVAVLAGVALVALLVMIGTSNKSLAAVAVIVAGLAFGPIFPTIIGVTFSRVAPEIHGSVFAIMFAIGLLGATIIPAAIGFFSRGRSIRGSLGIAAGTAAALVLIAWMGLAQV